MWNTHTSQHARNTLMLCSTDSANTVGTLRIAVTIQQVPQRKEQRCRQTPPHEPPYFRHLVRRRNTRLARHVLGLEPQSQIVDFIISQANEILETEREQIEEAYEKGCDNAHDWHSDPTGKNLTAEQYYKDTYQ